MKLRALRSSELTPDARIDAAKRKLVEAIDDLVEARLAKGAATAEWIDQDASPLGRDRHLKLVRKGVLPAAKDGHRRLVRKQDIDAYLDAHPVAPKTAPAAEDDVDEMVRRIAGVSR